MNMQRRSTATPRYLLLLSGIALATLLSASPVLAQVITLGNAQNFAVLGGSTVTNTGNSVITGDVGVSPGSSITGFPPGVVVSGAIRTNDGVAIAGQTSLAAASTQAANIACGTDLTGQNLGGLTLLPGVYCFTGSAQLTGPLTLNLQGNPNAFFLFKIGSTLTTASGSSVVLLNSGGTTCPQNVFFRVGSSATFGTASTFAGNVIAEQSITLTTGAQLQGRALARVGAVTLDTNNVTRCGAAVAGPGADVPLSPMLLLMMGVGLAAVAFFTLRR